MTFVWKAELGMIACMETTGKSGHYKNIRQFDNSSSTSTSTLAG